MSGEMEVEKERVEVDVDRFNLDLFCKKLSLRLNCFPPSGCREGSAAA